MNVPPETNCGEFDPKLGWIPSAPCPFYVWQFWRWQKVRCTCGKEFVTRELGLVPSEYKSHYLKEHAIGSEDAA